MKSVKIVTKYHVFDEGVKQFDELFRACFVEGEYVEMRKFRGMMGYTFFASIDRVSDLRDDLERQGLLEQIASFDFVEAAA